MIRAWLSALLLWAAAAYPAAGGPATDPAELSPTWGQAFVLVPDGRGRARRLDTSDLAGYLAQNATARIVLYAHGCDGIGHKGRAAGRFYARNGYVFVAPDSFARPGKIASCRPLQRQGGLHREVLAWRHAEIDHALTQLRRITPRAVALAGHSEGGITVATYRGRPVAARIVEGWTCHAGWPEYRGLNAPAHEPVLSLVAQDDPWFQIAALRGDCGPFMDGNDRSVVFRAPDPLHRSHWLIKDARVQKIVLAFLSRQF